MKIELFGTGLALVIFSLALQLKGLIVFGFAPDLVLAALIVLSAFLSLNGFIFVLLMSIWLLNWQPALPGALLLFAALVLAARGARHFLPWQPWFATIFLTVLAAVIFHVSLHAGVLWREPVIFAQIIVADILFGALTFRVLELVFGPVRRSRI